MRKSWFTWTTINNLPMDRRQFLSTQVRLFGTHSIQWSSMCTKKSNNHRITWLVLFSADFFWMNDVGVTRYRQWKIKNWQCIYNASFIKIPKLYIKLGKVCWRLKIKQLLILKMIKFMNLEYNFLIFSWRIHHFMHKDLIYWNFAFFSCCYRPKEDTVSEGNQVFVIYHPNGRVARFTLRYIMQSF